MEADRLRLPFLQLILGLEDSAEVVLPESPWTFWSEAAFRTFVEMGLLERAGYARLLTCDACERGCQIRPRPVEAAGSAPRYQHLCKVHRNETLEFDRERLARWRLSSRGVSRWLNRHLRLVGTPSQEHASFWYLGQRPYRGNSSRWYLAWHLPDQTLPETFLWDLKRRAARVVAPSRNGPTARFLLEKELTTLALEDVVIVDGESLALDEAQVSCAAGEAWTERQSGFEPPPGASWERVVFELIEDEKIRVRMHHVEAELTAEDFGLVQMNTSYRPVKREWTRLVMLIKAGGCSPEPMGSQSEADRKSWSRLRRALETTIGISSDPFFVENGRRRSRFAVHDLRADPCDMSHSPKTGARARGR